MLAQSLSCTVEQLRSERVRLLAAYGHPFCFQTRKGPAHTVDSGYHLEIVKGFARRAGPLDRGDMTRLGGCEVSMTSSIRDWRTHPVREMEAYQFDQPPKNINLVADFGPLPYLHKSLNPQVGGAIASITSTMIKVIQTRMTSTQQKKKQIHYIPQNTSLLCLFNI